MRRTSADRSATGSPHGTTQRRCSIVIDRRSSPHPAYTSGRHRGAEGSATDGPLPRESRFVESTYCSGDGEFASALTLRRARA